MKIINCKFKIALAPMAGITNSAFRLMNIFGGTDLAYSEMAHVNAISYNSKKTLGMLGANSFELPYIVQFFGKDPKYFAKATKIISERGVPVIKYEPFSKKQLEFIENFVNRPSLFGVFFHNFYSRFLDFQKQLQTSDSKLIADYLIPSGIDINLGCPAKKVFNHGGGAALWKDLKNVRTILETVLENTDLPVSIKVRTAVEKVTLSDLLEALKDLPIKRVMVHGRTYTQGFTGQIDSKTIRQASKKYPQFEFWVNGGIIDTESANKAVKETGSRNLGIARGTLGNPLLASIISSPREKKALESPRTEGLDIKINRVLAYIHSVLAYQSKGNHGIIEMRKHLAWYFKDFPGAKNWRKKLVTVKNIDDIENILVKISP